MKKKFVFYMVVAAFAMVMAGCSSEDDKYYKGEVYAPGGLIGSRAPLLRVIYAPKNGDGLPGKSTIYFRPEYHGLSDVEDGDTIVFEVVSPFVEWNGAWTAEKVYATYVGGDIKVIKHYKKKRP